MQAYYFASTYGSDPYGSATYNGAAQSDATTQSTTPTAGGGMLANTGFDVLLAVSLACLIIFVALLIRFWKRPRGLAQPTSTHGNDTDNTHRS